MIRLATITALMLGSLLLLSAQLASAAEPSPVELISSFRLKHGEIRVTSDATLNRIATEQAKAMAVRDKLDHSVLGSFSSRIAPAHAGRAAENIAYGYETFDKTLGQWINSSEHRKNLLLHKASRIGIGSAKDASGRRIYWAMEIAGDYEPKPLKGKKASPVVAKRAAAAADCHIRLLSLCL
jgi:uncharacterized protein YkwD